MRAAEYALGVLPHVERQEFAARLQISPELQNTVHFWDSRFVPMANEIDDVKPPAFVLRALEARLFGGTAPGSIWSSLGFLRGLAATSLAGIIVVAGLYLNSSYLAPLPEAGPTLITQLAGEANVVKLSALYNSDEGTIRLNRIDGDARPGRVLQLWLIEGGNNPVSLGVLPTDQTATVAVPVDLQDRFAGGAVLAVSDEPVGGSTTGQPSGDVLAVGQLATI